MIAGSSRRAIRRSFSDHHRSCLRVPTAAAHDFSDLSPRFVHGLELLLPASTADQPNVVLGLVAEVVNQLSPDVTPLAVNLVAAGSAPSPDQPFHRGQ